MSRTRFLLLAIGVVVISYLIGGIPSALSGAICFTLGFLIKRRQTRDWPWGRP